MRYRHPDTGQLLDSDEADFESTWKAQGFVPADQSPATNSGDLGEQEAEPMNLPAMTRDQLNALASSIGIPDPLIFPNKADLISAIELARSPQE